MGNSQARITQLCELLIKHWERLRIPLEPDNGGSECFCGRKSSPPQHTHHYLTNIWHEEYPSWLKAVRLCDVCFCWWHAFFPSVVSMYGHVNFSSVWTRMSVLCMHVSRLISCRFFQVSLILLFFNQSWGPWRSRKETLFQEVPARYCAAGLSANRTSTHLRKRKSGNPILSHSQIQLLLNPVLNGRCGLLCVCFELCDWHLVDGCDRNTHRLQSMTQHPRIKLSKECPFFFQTSQTGVASEVHHGSPGPHSGAEWWCHT